MTNLKSGKNIYALLNKKSIKAKLGLTILNVKSDIWHTQKNLTCLGK